MSTKTTFKRVALVAVAALGLGVLSVAPSNAAAISVTVTPSATTSTIKTGETATISLTVSGIMGGAGESLTVVGVRTKGSSGTVNFNGTTDSTTTQLRAGSASGAGAVLASGAYSADGIALDTTTVSASGTAYRAVVKANLVNPTTAGTYEVTIYTAGAGGAVGTADIKPFIWTVTVTADSKIADTSSTSTISAGTSNPGSADATVVATSATTGAAAAATIKFVASNATASTADPINVTVAGPGFLVAGTDTTTTMARANATARFVTTGTGATNYVLVYSDGTPGKSTITFTSSLSGVVLATETLTFADKKPSTVTVAVKKAYIAAGKTTPKVFSVSVKDSAGNLVTDSTITGTRTDTTTAGKAIATAALTCGSFDAKDLVYYCSATGTSSVAFGAAEYKITATGSDADETAVSATASTYYSDIVAKTVTISAPSVESFGTQQQFQPILQL
jgi:trimeric autotransporter adhesin